MARRKKTETKKTDKSGLLDAIPEKGITSKRYLFLAAYATNGNVRQSCEIAGCHPTFIHRLVREDPDFRAKFKLARKDSVQRLEQEARRRAEQGVQRLKFDKGRMICIPDPAGRTVKEKRLVKNGKGKPKEIEVEVPLMIPYVEHEYSDALMIFLLKANDPKKYRDRFEMNGKTTNLNYNVAAGNGTQLKSREQAIAELRALLHELETGEPGIIETNGHITNGNGETEK